jgi:hypothetical protein
LRQKHKLADRRDDLYETHPVATAALQACETIPPVVWEPACGPGAIARVLRASGHIVHATDLVEYFEGAQDAHGRDFLMETKAPDGTEAIITNPPFKLAGEFVAHALDLCPRVMMLLRLAFLEGARRSPILDGGALARVHVFRNRLPMMHRDGWEGKLSTSQTPFAWFVWDKHHRGPATIDRISWRP